ncbi:MAG: DNA-3-methyladenine glycosylase I, partial [Gemmatimonadota bacterium]|nr:DNA-3-methyladenine glycosylase I [Gemmatimonadota bacterium]
FDVERVARYGKRDVNRLLKNEGIIRNRLKVATSITNAQAFIDIQNEYGSFDEFVWNFVGGETIQNAWVSMKHLPAKTKESDAMSEELKERGMKFVGSTILYAYMQAAGMVNDHEVGCYRHAELNGSVSK